MFAAMTTPAVATSEKPLSRPAILGLMVTAALVITVITSFVDNPQALALAQSAQAQQATEDPIYTERYSLNPNGSLFATTALTTTTGRVTILMPHPDGARQREEGEPPGGEAEGRAIRAPLGQIRTQRVFLAQAMSWHPADWPEDSPWRQLFQNSRAWVG